MKQEKKILVVGLQRPTALAIAQDKPCELPCLLNLPTSYQSGVVCPFLQFLPALWLRVLLSNYTQEAPKEVVNQQYIQRFVPQYPKQVYNSQKKNPFASTSEWIHCALNRILFSNINEWTIDINNNMEKLHNIILGARSQRKTPMHALWFYIHTILEYAN